MYDKSTVIYKVTAYHVRELYTTFQLDLPRLSLRRFYCKHVSCGSQIPSDITGQANFWRGDMSRGM